MPGELEDALRRDIEAVIDREVAHLRGLLDLRLTSLVREVLAERLPPCKRPGPEEHRLDLGGVLVGGPLVCRDADGSDIGVA